MFNFLNASIAKIFGNKSDRDVKAILPLVDKIKVEFELSRFSMAISK